MSSTFKKPRRWCRFRAPVPPPIVTPPPVATSTEVNSRELDSGFGQLAACGGQCPSLPERPAAQFDDFQFVRRGESIGIRPALEGNERLAGEPVRGNSGTDLEGVT